MNKSTHVLYDIVGRIMGRRFPPTQKVVESDDRREIVVDGKWRPQVQQTLLNGPAASALDENSSDAALDMYQPPRK